MLNFLISLVVNALALATAAWLLDGMTLSGDLVDVTVVVLIFALLNALLKPILLFFSLPLLILTLGLFAFVVNAVVLLLTARLTDALTVSGFGTALVGALIVSIVTLVLAGALPDEAKRR